MKNWGIKSTMVAASLLCILAGSTAWAQQGTPPEELETLKGKVDDVIRENQELVGKVGVALGTEGVQLEDVRAPAVVICVQRDDDAVVLIDAAFSMEDAPHDLVRFRVEQDDAEVDSPVVIGHSDLGPLRGR